MTDIIVHLPGGKRAFFPAGTPPQEIESALAGLPGAQEPDANQGMRNAFGSGILQGYGDEAKAGLRALVGPAIQKGMDLVGGLDKRLGLEGVGGGQEDFQRSQMGQASQAPTVGARYDEELAAERDRAKAFQQSSPGLATTSTILGNVAGTAPLFAAAPGLTSMGPSLVGNIAKMGAVGAGTGAVQGFGEGEGFEDRATKALLHGGVGLAVGGAIPIAGAAGRKLLETGPGRYVSEKVVSPLARMIAGNPARSLSAAAPDGSPGVMGPVSDFADRTGNVAQSGAVDRLTTAMQRSGMTPAQIEARLKNLGPESVLADVDPQFLSAARSANTLPGQTKSVAKNVLEGRDRQAGSRLAKAFEGSEPPPSAYALRGEGQAFDQNLRAVGNRAYDAMDQAGLKQTPELMKLYENPVVDRAIKKVMAEEQATRVGTSRTPASPVDIMHKVKQEIQDMGVAETGRGSSTQSYFRDLASEYVRALKSANPKLAEADAAYAQAASLPEHFDVGAALLTREGTSEPALEKSAARLADMLAKADPQQRLAARTGATNAARNQAQESTSLARALARRVDESAPVQAKLADLYGPEWAGKISNQAAAERQFAETSNEILRGSKTADKAAEAMLDTNAHLRVDTSGVLPRFIQHIKDIPEMLVRPNESVRDAIGRATLNMDPSEKARLVRLIAQALQRRQQGSPLAASIAGSSGSTIPSSR
jgi:hypothetical protein